VRVALTSEKEFERLLAIIHSYVLLETTSTFVIRPHGQELLGSTNKPIIQSKRIAGRLGLSLKDKILLLADPANLITQRGNLNFATGSLH